MIRALEVISNRIPSQFSLYLRASRGKSLKHLIIFHFPTSVLPGISHFVVFKPEACLYSHRVALRLRLRPRRGPPTRRRSSPRLNYMIILATSRAQSLRCVNTCCYPMDGLLGKTSPMLSCHNIPPFSALSHRAAAAIIPTIR